MKINKLYGDNILCSQVNLELRSGIKLIGANDGQMRGIKLLRADIIGDDVINIDIEVGTTLMVHDYSGKSLEFNSKEYVLINERDIVATVAF